MSKVLSQHPMSDDIGIPENEADMSNYNKILNANTEMPGENTRVLAFKNKAPAPKDGYQSSLKVLYSQQAGKKSDMVKSSRHIPSAPVKVLDAPDLLDDYCE